MKTILALDDEPEILKCFKDALELRGFTVLTTTSQDACIDMVRRQPDIALLLLDVKMPGKTGFDVYREVRAFAAPPVLFITAYPKSFTVESDEVVTMWQEQFADGTTDILYKPFPLDSLFSKVEGLIGSPLD
ncbi:MAG: response regulator [Lentisphaerae bacterium]|nr:response regulator [Lentisphaerota bacterium]